jgi:hypothetical protein
LQFEHAEKKTASHIASPDYRILSAFPAQLSAFATDSPRILFEVSRHRPENAGLRAHSRKVALIFRRAGFPSPPECQSGS